ncbi:hypothetical protein QBC36DRAFT_236223 [Triangularia setosa]|uniref:Uncharacterized protein n=1 Tax=Triangularia setosa TaxID=2587417 RepID=A0AAN6W9P4_9PEZI|nr:hypothetical protein QBC36DRAFT_236223 [Podospora setosa]
MMGMTASAVEHRFRGVNAQAKGLRLAYELHENGEGPHPTEYDFSKISSNVWGKGGPRAEDLQKYFGASTEQGLQYHFRAIKQQANVLKDAVDGGEDPAEAFDEYLSNSGYGVKKGVSIKGGSTRAAKAAGAKAPSTKKRAATAPPPKTPSKSPTKKQKVKEEEGASPPAEVVDLPEIIDSPEAVDSPEVINSSPDADFPEVDYDALDDKEAPKPKENPPWKKREIGRPGQWSSLMSGERARLKAKNDEVPAAHAARNNAPISIDSSPITPNELPILRDTTGSASPTPRTHRVNKEGAHLPSTPAFKFDNIDINDDDNGDEDMDDDDEDWDDHGAI